MERPSLFTYFVDLGKSTRSRWTYFKRLGLYRNISIRWSHCYKVNLPCNRRMSKIRISWSTFARRRGRTQRRFRKTTCRWREGSTAPCRSSARWPWSWLSPRSCRQHWKEQFRLYVFATVMLFWIRLLQCNGL